MENLEILNTRNKKDIEKKIKKQFGCDFKLDFAVFKNSKNKLFLLNKDVEKIRLDELRINSLGLYFGENRHAELRLSTEGAQLVGKKATKNIIELDDAQAEQWMNGKDFEYNSEFHGFVIIKNKDNILGCGRLKDTTLLNYVQKERRT